MALVFHITDMLLWEDALNRGVYRHPSLKTEGFIHCSTAAQLLGTADRFFADSDELVVLHVPEARVRAVLRYDADPVTGKVFPHLYGPLPIEAIADVSIVARNADGSLDWPPGLRQG